MRRQPLCGAGEERMRSDPAIPYGQDRLPRYTSYPTAPHFSATTEKATIAADSNRCPPIKRLRSTSTILPIDVLILWVSHVRRQTRRSRFAI